MPEKIKEARLAKGLSLRSLAAKLKVTYSSIGNWERGESEPKSGNLSALASVLEVSVESLLDDTTSLIVRSRFGVDVPFYPDVTAMAGCGAFTSEESNVESFSIPDICLGSVDPSNVACIQIKGDSMEPLLKDNAIVAVDRSRCMLEDGKVFVVRVGDLVRVKILLETPLGISLKSLNDRYPIENYDVNSNPGLVIIGRVFWFTTNL